MTELPHKYEVPVKVVEKAIKLSDKTKEELKASGMMDDKGKLKLKGVSPKMLKRMKEESVDCPVLKSELPFIQCFVVKTTNGQRRTCQSQRVHKSLDLLGSQQTVQVTIIETEKDVTSVDLKNKLLGRKGVCSVSGIGKMKNALSCGGYFFLIVLYKHYL